MENLIKELHSEGLNDNEIALKLNVSNKKVWYIRSKKLELPTNFSYFSKIKYSKELLEEFVSKKLTIKEISEKLNTRESNIYLAFNRNKITPYSKPKKEVVELTKRQREILVGTLLGDSTVYLDKNCINSRYTCSHSLKQEDLIDWKANEFASLEAKTSYATSKVDKRTGKQYYSKKVFTGNKPALNEFRELFYPNGTKIIPVIDLDDFTDLSLAVLFMDDGHKSNQSIGFSTCSFTKSNLEDFILFLKGRFNIEFTIHHNNCLYLKKKYLPTFKNIVSKHLLDCVKYKLN